MDMNLFWQGLTAVAGATGATAVLYYRYRDVLARAQELAAKYPLLKAAIMDLAAAAKVYYAAKADGKYTTEETILMGNAQIKFLDSLEAIGFNLGMSSIVKQITPLIPNDTTIKIVQDQINQAAAATPAPITLSPGTVIVSTGSTDTAIAPSITREG